MTLKKIAIIIPVFNCVPYIDRCINSVVRQTYKDLEIILVDDGSTDGSGEICDKYAKADKRIRVIHKDNTGLSASRNIGIESSKAPYIAFVDADDWMPDFAMEILYDALVKNDADIAIGQIKKVYSDKTLQKRSKDPKIAILSNEAALENMMYMKSISNSASGKLYKRTLFTNISYPVGKTYEDLGTAYKLFAASKKIASIDETIYYYYQNNGSITHQKYTEKSLDAIKFAEEELSFVEKNFKKIKGAAKHRLFYESLLVLSKMPIGHKGSQEIKQEIKSLRKTVLNDSNLSVKRRLLFLSSYLGQAGVKIAFSIRLFFSKMKNK